jgi:hypothetical protein
LYIWEKYRTFEITSGIILKMNLPLYKGFTLEITNKSVKLLIKFQNILRNTTQVIIRHSVKILFSVISSPITLERQKWKSSKMKIWEKYRTFEITSGIILKMNLPLYKGFTLEITNKWWPLTTLNPPAPHICPTYFHNQNITDCSDQKWKGPSSLHR